MKASTLLTALVYAAALSGLCLAFRDFVLDDSFISFRYAEHLARHGTLAWNLGEDPVEGFTSPLWALLNAGAIRLGWGPVVFSKVASVVAGLAIVLGLCALAERRGVARVPAIVLPGALALSPAFAFLTMQGMETTLTAALLCAGAVVACRALEAPSAARFALWNALAFVAVLARPDTLLFNFGAGLTMLAVLLARRDGRAARALLAATAGLVLAFAAYVALRWSYFGHPFPNPFYLKAGVEGPLWKSIGVKYVADFLLRVVLPYLSLVVAFATTPAGRRGLRRRLVRSSPVLVGGALFLGYVLGIQPIQGFLWRYCFPVLPPLLAGALFLLEGRREEPERTRRPRLAALVVLLFAAWPLKDLPLALDIQRTKAPLDRVLAGRALAGLDGTMFVTEAGALPLYSRWRSVDLLGLTSEEIAHEGLSLELLERLEPDLVMALGQDGPFRTVPKYELMTRYMAANGFELVDCILKSGERHHFYFARRGSPLFDAIVRRLRATKGVVHRDPESYMAEPRIPVHP